MLINNFDLRNQIRKKTCMNNNKELRFDNLFRSYISTFRYTTTFNIPPFFIVFGTYSHYFSENC
jgi:hypothetical protein